MNVASRELSEELYRLSGWTTKYWNYERVASKDGVTHKPLTPKYDLGYLLTAIDPKIGTHLYKAFDDDGTLYWRASDGFDGSDLVEHYLGQADEPADAVAMYAVELFKQGVLARGGE